MSSLMRSQRLYSKLAGISYEAFVIKWEGIESFIFMELRAKYKWVSFQVPAYAWVTYTHEYNDHLEEDNDANGIRTIQKNLRALVKMLSEIEVVILTCLAQGDFACEYSCTHFL